MVFTNLDCPKKIDASGQQKWRIVVDYRKLNDITVGDSYPIPQISEILDQLGQSKYFSTLASGFHQISINEEEAPKTAFSVPQGHYQFTRMPFGLKNLSSVFQRLRNYNLKLQPDKCEFLRREVAYLGHQITKDGVKPNPEKVKRQGPIGKDRPIAFASRTLNKSECNYNTTEKELLAILFGCKTFRPYLYGRKFKIITDHRPLKWLFNHKDSSSKLQRWRLKLMEYEYEIEYQKGKLNATADALSRYPFNDGDFLKECIEIAAKKMCPEAAKNFEKIQLNRMTIQRRIMSLSCNIAEQLNEKTKIIDFFSLALDESQFNHQTLILFHPILIKMKITPHLNSALLLLTQISVHIYHNAIIYPTPSEIPRILRENHDIPITGHLGSTRMYNRVKERYFKMPK
ncbi:unnamed protein product [Parnassius mnemosyne]|uniref:RNA-directed DNA polymerase n=1 Tax=Parnassius mnemosyne TaxID=213953 RepID=A0AAV1KH94_9NEOP